MQLQIMDINMQSVNVNEQNWYIEEPQEGSVPEMNKVKVHITTGLLISVIYK